MQSLPEVRSILYFTEHCDYFHVGSYWGCYCWLLFTAVLCKRITVWHLLHYLSIWESVHVEKCTSCSPNRRAVQCRWCTLVTLSSAALSPWIRREFLPCSCFHLQMVFPFFKELGQCALWHCSTSEYCEFSLPPQLLLRTKYFAKSSFTQLLAALKSNLCWPNKCQESVDSCSGLNILTKTLLRSLCSFCYEIKIVHVAGGDKEIKSVG